MNWWNTKI